MSLTILLSFLRAKNGCFQHRVFQTPKPAVSRSLIRRLQIFRNAGLLVDCFIASGVKNGSESTSPLTNEAVTGARHTTPAVITARQCAVCAGTCQSSRTDDWLGAGTMPVCHNHTRWQRHKTDNRYRYATALYQDSYTSNIPHYPELMANSIWAREKAK